MNNSLHYPHHDQNINNSYQELQKLKNLLKPKFEFITITIQSCTKKQHNISGNMHMAVLRALIWKEKAIYREERHRIVKECKALPRSQCYQQRVGPQLLKFLPIYFS